ncbi:UNVERIFIED_CONTAM: diketogulonate reductase-like aldo/keto reductase [Williamsia faeni]
MSLQSIELAAGTSIPQLGLGVFQVVPEVTESTVEKALRAGYRHIDTAAIYGNEAEVGKAVAGSDLDRSDIFVTTKLWNSEQGFETTLAAFEKSRAALGLDVIDLYLIHWPTPERDKFVDSWRALEKLQADGAVRAIGVSNFRVVDLQRLLDEGLSTPSINQIELHPYLAQPELREFHRKHGIVTEAWSPLGRGGAILTDPVVTSIAAELDASAAQVLIAWQLAIGNVVIPRSTNVSRISENLAAAEITLTADQLNLLNSLDRAERIGPDPADLN